MAGINNRVPDGSSPPWEGLKGPATANVGDAGLTPVKNPKAANFEAVDPTKHEARFSRTHAVPRKYTGHAGAASFAAQGQSRGIKPAADFGAVSANKLNPAVSHGSQSPKRGPQKTTATADSSKPSPLT
jgi:hypothetical protein